MIYGAVAIYFLLSFVHYGTGAPVQWQQLVSYSLITLSTAGYGDVSPVSPRARMLAGLEATVGVMYVAILMARLVSLYDVQRRVLK